MRRLLPLVVAWGLWACTAGAQAPTAVLSRYDFGAPLASFDLPGRLDEVSGLAVTPDGRLFAHDDEVATIHEINFATGAVGKRFSLGDPPVRGDFEGLVIVGERFFLVTSSGLLHEFREAGDRERTEYRVTDTGLGRGCEVEGLDYDAQENELLLACKTVVPERGVIVVHRLPIDPAAPRPPAITVARSQLGALGVDEDFEPSSILVAPTGTLVLVSATAEALLEIDRTGRALAGVALDRRRHRQPEGLAFSPDGALWIADEENRDDAHVTAYGSRSSAQPR